ncbi:MAG: glycosyltransferase [Acidimicrobiales bacterium]
MTSLASDSQIVLWAPLSPVGGVTRSAQNLAEWLDERQRLAGVVDLGKRWQLPLATVRNRRTTQNVFWCSTPASVWAHSLLASPLRGRRTLFLHGGLDDRSPRRPPRTPRRRFDAVYVTNTALATLVDDWRLGPPAVLASAHIPRGIAKRTRHRYDRLLVLVGAIPNWYGLELAVDAWKHARREKPDLTLTVLLYGGVDTHPAVAEVLDAHPEVAVHREVEPADMAQLLDAHDVLLRPGSVDGDSLIVREALEAGLRVVATDSVPRPIGTEVCPPDPLQIARAIIHGGAPSTGRGLGPSIVTLL